MFMSNIRNDIARIVYKQVFTIGFQDIMVENYCFSSLIPNILFVNFNI